MPELRPFSLIQANTRSKSRINALYKSVYILLLNRKETKYTRNFKWRVTGAPLVVNFDRVVQFALVCA